MSMQRTNGYSCLLYVFQLLVIIPFLTACGKNCSELSVEECRNDDGPCRVIVATEINEGDLGGYCDGAQQEFCVDSEGPNCSDADVVAYWTDSEGQFFMTGQPCAPDDFERVSHVNVSDNCE